MDSPIVVMDNGGGFIRAGSTRFPENMLSMPNTTARIKKSLHELIGEETETAVTDRSQLMYHRPIEKGYVVNWDLQTKVWKRMFDQDHLNIDPQDSNVYVSCPVLMMDEIMESMIQVAFEHFRFSRFLAAPAPLWSFRSQESVQSENHVAKTVNSGLVVESGFSFTHIVPIVEGKICVEGVRRINVGGKLLTNLLKEQVSFRQVNVQDCTDLMNTIKEKFCYLSLDVFRDLDNAKHAAAKNRTVYVLPDYVTSNTGYVLKEGEKVDTTQQVICLTNERFMVPEALFHPSDIGINQAGIAESVGNCLAGFAPGIRDILMRNILLTGGNCRIPNFYERFTSALHPYMEEGREWHVTVSPDPQRNAWQGGMWIARQEGFMNTMMTRSLYEEYGSSRLLASCFSIQ